MILVTIMIVAAVALVITGAFVFLSELGPMDGLLGLLLGCVGVSTFVAAGVVVSLKDAEERLQSLLSAEGEKEARSPPSDQKAGSANQR